MRAATTARLAWAALALAASACERGPQPDKFTALDRRAHDVHFPIETGRHAGVDCNACHGTTDSFREFDCLGCHTQPTTDPLHGGVGDYAWASTSCLVCHPRGEVAAAEGHERIFPIGAGTTHASARCADCHLDSADRKKVTCVGCHEHDGATMTAPHAQVGGFEWDTARCLRCHGDSQVHRVQSHVFGIQGGTPHARQSCLLCHPGMREDKAFAAEFRLADCIGCHVRAETEPPHAAVDGFAYENTRCLDCHPTGDRQGIDHAPIFPIGTGTAHATARCADCHQDAANRKNVTCTGCHEHAAATMTTAHARVGGYAYTSSRCLQCHADAQVDGVAAHLPFRISTGDHFRESCLVCHDARRVDKPFGQDFQRTQCLNCHRGEHDGRYPNSQCLNCHADGKDP